MKTARKQNALGGDVPAERRARVVLPRASQEIVSFDLRLGDCLSGMASLADKSIDVAIFDAPYSEHTHAKVRRGGSVHAPDRTEGVKRPVISTSVVLGFDALSAELRDGVAREVARVCRRWTVAFSDAESVHLWARDLAAHGMEHVRIGAWRKRGGSPQFTGDRPGIGFEAIEIAHPPGKKRWNGGGAHGFWDFPIESGNRVHPTQKPIDLMLALVSAFSEPGEIVLDPFSGGGSTGVAALRSGRRFLGFERDAGFHAAALARLTATREQFALPGFA